MREPDPADEATMEEMRASIRRAISAMAVEPLQESAATPAEPFSAKEYEPGGGTTDEAPDVTIELTTAQAMGNAEAEGHAEAPAVPTAPKAEQYTAAPSSVMTAQPPTAALAAGSTPPPAPAPTSAPVTRASGESGLAGEARPALTRERGGPPPPLLSPHTDGMVSSTFNELATTMRRSGSARTLDGLVEDMLRPMLGSWLDVNLPPLVEKLVREEIERLSRRSR
jgi:cell pole-organizing protein PopZ